VKPAIEEGALGVHDLGVQHEAGDHVGELLATFIAPEGRPDAG
jgi:hypothetical protein